MSDAVNNPAHYGGVDDLYEAIKVIEAWGLGYHLGNTLKYIRRAGHKGDRLTDLEKARWFLEREIQNAARLLIKQAVDGGARSREGGVIDSGTAHGTDGTPPEERMPPRLRRTTLPKPDGQDNPFGYDANVELPL